MAESGAADASPTGNYAGVYSRDSGVEAAEWVVVGLCVALVAFTLVTQCLMRGPAIRRTVLYSPVGFVVAVIFPLSAFGFAVWNWAAVRGVASAPEATMACVAALALVPCIVKLRIDGFGEGGLYAPPRGTRLDGRVAVITGGNTGLGYGTARILALHGATVVLACRSEEKGKSAAKRLNDECGAQRVTFEQLDLSSLANVRAFAQRCNKQHSTVHWLVNNAGMWPAVGARTAEGLESGLGTMHVGHHYLTQLLQGALLRAGTRAQPARVINVSSWGHTKGSFHPSLMEGDGEGDLRGEVTDGGFASYGRAKLANVLETLELGRRLTKEGANVVTHSLHPGAVLTDIWRVAPPGLKQVFYLTMAFAMRSTPQGASLIAWLCLDGQHCKTTAVYSEGFAEPGKCSALARDEALASRLWEVTERLISDFERKTE